MIYILSGVAKSGKSYLATKILREKSIANFSTDYLMMSLALGNPKLNIDYDADDFLVAAQLEPYLFHLISAMARNGIDYLIEGVHFKPAFARTLMDTFPGKIRVLYLGYHSVDPQAKLAEFRRFANVMENYWFRYYDDAAMTKLIGYLINASKKYAEGAKNVNIPYIEITDIAKQADEIISELFQN